MRTPSTAWHPAARVAFRFAFGFLGLCALHIFSIDLLFARVPEGLNPYWVVVDPIVRFLSGHVLGIELTGPLSGYSDSLASWLLLFWNGAFAAAIAAVWTAASRAAEHRRLLDGLRTAVRYLVATTMFAYGIDKVLLVQFFSLSPADLVQTYADSSPFALAWRFLGSSPPYQIFGGVLETAGAVLLLWRRTTTLGALVLAGVLTNVVMLNLCYDIPVKHFSIVLLAMSGFLLVEDARRLFDFLVLHRVVTPAPLRARPLSARLDRTRIAVKTLYCLGFGAALSIPVVQMGKRRAQLPPLSGLYDVERFRRGGVEVPLRFGDAALWQQVAFGRVWGPTALIITSDGERHAFDAIHDEQHGTVSLIDDADAKAVKHELGVRRVDGTHLELAGRYFGEDVEVRLRLHDLSRATLLTRVTHWVSDGGYYR
jgi:hypothetical protein